MASRFPEFIAELKAVRDRVRIIATGAPSGNVLKVTPRDDDQRSLNTFMALLTFLAGGAIGGGLIVLRTLSQTSGSQDLGVIGATPSSGAKVPEAIALIGYCLQAARPEPQCDEPYVVTDPPRDTVDQLDLIRRAMELGVNRGGELADEYSFIPESESALFVTRFTQSLVWLITDNISYDHVKFDVFRPRFLDKLFFIPSCFEVILWLRKSLEDLGALNRHSQFNLEVMDVLAKNVELGMVAQTLVDEWASKFGFSLVRAS